MGQVGRRVAHPRHVENIRQHADGGLVGRGHHGHHLVETVEVIALTRLLRLDRTSGQVTVVATGLDAPTNLAIDPTGLYVAEGMGTPGRPMPGPNGVVKLDGFIEHIALSP